MSRFFIDRPIFAWVLAIITCIVGILALTQITLEQFPKIAPPVVTISTGLAGASADTVEKTVTQVIEKQLHGVDNMTYYLSNSSSNGGMTIEIYFEQNTNADIAQVQVQNIVQKVMPLLPQDVRTRGVSVNKSAPSYLLIVAIYSKSGSTDKGKLGDIISSDISKALSQINGVGNVGSFSSSHAMRIWLKPEKLYSFNLSPAEVVSSIQKQNIDITAGQLGSLPAVKGQQLNVDIKSNSRFETVQDFEEIILNSKPDGSVVKLKDVADIEIGSDSYRSEIRYNKKQAAALSITLESSANALSVLKAVKDKMKELESILPDDVGVIYPYDAMPFIKASIKSVVSTLLEAFILVFIVIFIFLQNFRATLIPSIAIPVVMLGTCAILYVFGFSINTLTMFAMVLSIGLLVDDAIVVVENVERIMHEEGLSPLEATKKSMDQIKGALVGIGVVLSAVFIPMAFLGGSVGVIYRQFSITIVSSMTLSVLVALILSPPLCALLLKPKASEGILTNNAFFTWLNKIIKSGQGFFVSKSEFIISKTTRFILIYVVMIGGIVFLFFNMQKSFLPEEDVGFLQVVIFAPQGATFERTAEAVNKIEDYIMKNEGINIEEILTVPGASGNQNFAFGFIKLKDWSKRKKRSQSAEQIFIRLFTGLSDMNDANAYVFPLPPIQELGQSSGFNINIVDLKNREREVIESARTQVIKMANENPLLQQTRANTTDSEPTLKLDIDKQKAASLGVSLSDVSSLLGIAFGSYYVGDFTEQGEVKRVLVQAKDNSRMLPSDFDKWFVKNSSGKMVPLSAFSTIKWIESFPDLERFDGYPSIGISGSGAPGVSSGIAMNIMEDIVKKLPEGFAVRWSGLSYEEKKSGSKSLFLYSISILFIFLCLAALYESWSVPFAVLLVIPFGFFGAVTFSMIFGLHNDIYFQIALLTIIGLCAKNAILIVEFAKEMHEKGMGIVESVLHSVEQRFRPIMMTSVAFALGVLPLAIARGVGSNAQNAIGISIIGGMIFATFIAPLFVPFFYISILKLTKKK